VDETVDQAWARAKSSQARAPLPGIVIVFSVSRPLLVGVPIPKGGLYLGRGRVGEIDLDDTCLSRRHAEVSREGGSWRVRDLGSRNGTAVDGVLIDEDGVSDAHLRVLRVGDTLALFAEDVRPFMAESIADEDGVLVGPTLRKTWRTIADAARSGATLHITGESGTGKELAARYFHASSQTPRGPFVAVNCATIAPGLAERLLFGAKRGAYSSADADAEGHLQAADGGTLFLDEIAELDASVQAKLLRVIETREVVPLGSAKPRTVVINLCSATHGDLRERVAQGTFREDLYFRLGRPDVAIPALRERREEIPWHIVRAIEPLTAHASLVEAALLRDWPGNVREMVVELGAAARAASASDSEHVEADHLSALAGVRSVATPPTADAPDRESIIAALRKEGGNVTRAARAIGTHRTQLRRWIERFGIDPASCRETPDER